MTVAPTPERTPARRANGGRHGSLGRWAVALSAVSGIAVAVIAVGLAVGGDSFMDDNLWFSGTAVAVGFTAAAAACVAGIVAIAKGERRRLLWVPICVFPALVVFLLLGEAFWWE
jgi:hypothetical protein